MILFADTSALLKHYVEEAHSSEVHAAFEQARAVAVVRIAWAEAHAALARRAREVPANGMILNAVKKALAADWAHYALLEVSQPLVVRAGDYAEAFALRAYDSVQLAAAKLLQEEAGEEVSFACFDSRLCKAAGILGLTVPFS